ncbi:MAG: hypothetical protein K0U37_01800 [Gammaproteobacteria bacterium]|nr:hypothetical protein [Gammaproteobacteria bacterium]
MHYFNRIALGTCLILLSQSGFSEIFKNPEAFTTQSNALFSIVPCPGSPSPKGSISSDHEKHVFYCIKNNTKNTRHLRLSKFNSPAVKLLPHAGVPYALPECSEEHLMRPNDTCVAHITISGAILALLHTTVIEKPTVSVINPDGTTSSTASTTTSTNSIQATSDTRTTPSCTGTYLVGACNLTGITASTCSDYFTSYGTNCQWEPNVLNAEGTMGVCVSAEPCTIPNPLTYTPPTCKNTTFAFCNEVTRNNCGIVHGDHVLPEIFLQNGLVYYNAYFAPCVWTPGVSLASTTSSTSLPYGCIGAGPPCNPT